MGIVGLWHLLSRSIPAAWNPARMWLYLPVRNDLCCFLKQWEEEPGKHFHSEVMEGAVWERDWPLSDLLASVKQGDAIPIPLVLCFTPSSWGSGVEEWEYTIGPSAFSQTLLYPTNVTPSRLASESVKPREIQNCFSSALLPCSRLITNAGSRAGDIVGTQYIFF